MAHKIIDPNKLSEEATDHNMEANHVLGEALVEALVTRRPVMFSLTFDFSEKNLPDGIYLDEPEG